MNPDIEKRQAIIAQINPLADKMSSQVREAHAIAIGAILVRERANRSGSADMARHADILDAMAKQAMDEHTARVEEIGRIMRGVTS